MFTSYGETSGFSAVGNNELALINGGKGSSSSGSSSSGSGKKNTAKKSVTPNPIFNDKELKDLKQKNTSKTKEGLSLGSDGLQYTHNNMTLSAKVDNVKGNISSPPKLSDLKTVSADAHLKFKYSY